MRNPLTPKNKTKKTQYKFDKGRDWQAGCVTASRAGSVRTPMGEDNSEPLIDALPLLKKWCKT
jgi:hypothetical protein